MRKFLGQPNQGPVPAGLAATPPPAPAGGGGTGQTRFDITDLKQYLHVVAKRIWLVLLCFILAIAVALFSLLRQEPFYRANTVIQVTSSSGLPGIQGLNDSRFNASGADYYAIQESLIANSRLIRRAQERLGLPVEEINRQIIRVYGRSNKRMARLEVVVESKQPIIGAELANLLAEEFLEYKTELKLDTSQETVIDLTQKANRFREELRKEEEKLDLFKQNNQVFAYSDKGNTAAKHMSDLMGQASGFRNRRLMLEAVQPHFANASDDIILQMLADSPEAVDISRQLNAVGTDKKALEELVERGILSQPRWLDLRRQKARTMAEMVALQAKYLDSHPIMLRQKETLKDLDLKLEVELQFALESYYTELDSLRIRENAARQVAAQWEREAEEYAAMEQDYRRMERQVNRLNNLYDATYDRLKQMEISFSQESEILEIINRAMPATTPVGDHNIKNIFIAALVGLGLGIGLVFVLEYIDDSIRYPEEVMDTLRLPFFGVIPSANWDPEDLHSHMLSNIDQKSGLAEAYRNVRSALLFSGHLKPGSTLAFTSAVPREGKTTTCLNMAVSLAQANSRTLVVDADMRRGELHKFFGLEGGRGLSDLLEGHAKPEALVQRTGIPNLDLIATGPFPTHPAELLLRPEFKSFLEWARRSYDHILFDCPPIMAVSESAVLASMADNVIFVVWAGQTSRKLSQTSVNILRERGANLAGCILNNLEFGRVGYYYYSTYYGYYDYDYRYDQDR